MQQQWGFKRKKKRLFFLFPLFKMSAKPKVYQGVRVKITVKELLQQRRALQAEKNASESQESRMQSSDPFPSCSGTYMDCEPMSSTPSCHQTKQFPSYIAHEESLSLVDQLFLDAYLQPDPITDTTLNILQNPSFCSPEDNIQSAPIFFNQSMTPESPSDSSDISNSFEYSPTHQGIPCAPQSFSSLSQQEPRSCAFADMEHYYQQQNSSTVCYGVYCGSTEHQEAIKMPDPFSYPNSDYMEYIPSSTVTEEFFRREMNNYDICYS